MRFCGPYARNHGTIFIVYLLHLFDQQKNYNMKKNNYDNERGERDPRLPNPTKQEQSDPQITELKGFVDKNEKLEPMDNEIDRANEEQKDVEG